MNANRQLLSVPLEQLLVSGSDTRSTIDERTGLNSFGCSPSPRPEAFGFGSCTASSISGEAFRLVEQERDDLLKLSSPLNLASRKDLLEAKTENLRSALKQVLALEKTAVEIVFSPSGTDGTLHALFLARILSRMAPLDSIVVASDATGSGVPHALSGRHFSAVTAAGVAVTQGGPIAGLSENVTLISLPLRGPDGVLRDPSKLDQELFDTVARSVAAGHHVLLQIMDISKLGGRYPGPDCLRAIQRQFANSVHIVVDACQMRISLARLQWHLAQGHMVLISGSKFFTGPPFSGALLVPASLSSPLETVHQVPPGLQDYTDSSAWPRAWRTLRAAMPDRVNFGQYFRWIAAMEEMRAYFSIPPGFRCAALHQFAAMATDIIQSRCPDLLLLEEWQYSTEEIHSEEIHSEEIDEAEMGARTIFPFLVRRGKAWNSFEESKTLYSALNQDVTARLSVSLSPQEKVIASTLCHIGQPVSMAQGDSKRAGALRICASARTVSQLWARRQCDLSALSLTQERHEISTVLDKIALFSRAA